MADKRSPPQDRDHPPSLRFLIVWRVFVWILMRFAWYSGLTYVYRKLVTRNPSSREIHLAPSYGRWHINRAALAIADHLIRRAASRPEYVVALRSIRADLEALHPDGALAQLQTFVRRVEVERTAGSLDAPLADELAEFAARLLELLGGA